MALLDDMMLVARADEAFRPEVSMAVDAAKDELRRVGISEALVDAEPPAPLVRQAVALYVKSQFGFDNPDADRFFERFRQTAIDLANSTANEASALEYNMSEGGSE